MPNITAIDRALLCAVLDGPQQGAAETTITGEWRQLLSATDEPAFLAAVAGKAGSYNPLPDVGEWLEAGAIYGYAGGAGYRAPVARPHHLRARRHARAVQRLSRGRGRRARMGC